MLAYLSGPLGTPCEMGLPFKTGCLGGLRSRGRGLEMLSEHKRGGGLGAWSWGGGRLCTLSRLLCSVQVEGCRTGASRLSRSPLPSGWPHKWQPGASIACLLSCSFILPRKSGAWWWKRGGGGMGRFEAEVGMEDVPQAGIASSPGESWLWAGMGNWGGGGRGVLQRFTPNLCFKNVMLISSCDRFLQGGFPARLQ